MHGNRCHIPYDPRYGPVLKRLGLYQISQFGNIVIDRGLITALVERWRPETNTFHLPVGEMTVTLEDVSCLWGLPINGKILTGEVHDDWSGLIYDSLGVEPNWNDVSIYKKKPTCPTGFSR